MQCLVRMAFVILACSVTSMGYAQEYSQATIDSNISDCTIGDFFSQARCECAIKQIQQSMSEEDYKASLKEAVQTGEVKPEALAVFYRVPNVSCRDIGFPDDRPHFPLVP